MTTYLYNNLLTVGADRMAEIDPSGVILTVIAVTVVFTALTILFGLYSLSGAIFSGKFKKKAKAKDEIAAAIAMALDAYQGSNEDEVQVAIATALHLYLSQSVHDIEPGIITIKSSQSDWNNKSRNFRKYERV